jgi:hypothetical protein
MLCPFCSDTKKVQIIDEPETEDQDLADAIRKGQKIVEVDCVFCT